MARRAILTAFSTASEPELKRAEVLACEPGREGREFLTDLDVALIGRDHEAGVRERGDLGAHGVDEFGYGVTDVVTAMPEPRSKMRLPSTSTRIAPSARSM